MTSIVNDKKRVDVSFIISFFIKKFVSIVDNVGSTKKQQNTQIKQTKDISTEQKVKPSKFKKRKTIYVNCVSLAPTLETAVFSRTHKSGFHQNKLYY